MDLEVSTMSNMIPDTSDGYLPLFVLAVGLTAVINAGQCYKDTSYLQRIYRPPSSLNVKAATPSPVTPLSARTFATWNLAVGIVRLIASYHLSEASWYQMSILTNVIGIMHFGSEAFIYRTCTPSGPWLAPVSVAVVGLTWHLTQYSNYVH